MSELCHACRKPILPNTEVWVDIQVSRQTHSSPAEYESVPLHRLCAEYDSERDEAYERQAARDRNDDFSRTNGRDWT